MTTGSDENPCCPDCGVRVGEHARFFTIHEDRDGYRCGRCYHRRRAIRRPDVVIPAWLADEIMCLLGLADGIPDLARRTSKEIGCECGKEVKDEQGRVVDRIELCIYHQAQDVDRRGRDVLRWLEEAGVPRGGA